MKQSQSHFTRLLILFTALVISAVSTAQGLRSLNSLDANSRPVPLPIDQAFPFYVSESAPGRYQVTWTVAPDHYLYRHAFNFELQSGAGTPARPVEFSIPDGISKDDQFFGRVEAYYTRVSADLQLVPVSGPETVLIIEFQGCAEWGFCYPPQRISYPLPR